MDSERGYPRGCTTWSIVLASFGLLLAIPTGAQAGAPRLAASIAPVVDAAPGDAPPAPAASPLSPPSRTAPSLDPPPLDAPPGPRPAAWYGWQILLSDGVSLSLLAFSTACDCEVLAWGAIGGLALGGPIVHATRGHGGRALASASLRPGLMVAGLLAGYSIANSSSACEQREFGCLGGAFVGGVVGLVSAEVIDVGVLAWSPAQISPVVSPSGPVTTFGLAGSF